MQRLIFAAAVVLLAASPGCNSTTTKPADTEDFGTEMFLEEAKKSWDLYETFRAVKADWEIHGTIPTNEQRQAVETALKTNLDNAVMSAEKVCALAPKNAVAHALLGFAKYHKGEYEEAIKAAENAYEIDSGYSDVYLIRAHVHYKYSEKKIEEGRFDEAAELLEGAIEDLSSWVKRNELKTLDAEKERANIKLWQMKLEKLKQLQDIS